jgi:peptidyl-prolyl cis-trans isomerase D
MAAIGSIRKHGVLVMIIIGFALVLFLLTGLFDGNTLNRIFYSDQYSQGKINGENVDQEYQNLYNQTSALLRVFQNVNSLEEAAQFQAHQIAWMQLIYEKLFDEELLKLGIVYTEEMRENLMEEARTSLSTQQPNQMLGAYFQYLANRFGVEQAQQIIMYAEQDDQFKTTEYYEMYKAVERRILFEDKMNIYLAFSRGSIIFSDALAQYTAEHNDQLMTTLLSINLNAPAFNDIQIETNEKELKDFYNKNKKRYENIEATRNVEMAVFPVLPSIEDKTRIADTVNRAYERLLTATSINDYNSQEMYMQIDSSFHKKGDAIRVYNGSSVLNYNVIDTLENMIFTVPVGGMIAPFNHQDNAWFFGKCFGIQTRPDSILVAALVIDYRTSQNQNATRSKKEARLLADSLKMQLMAGQSIFTLMPNYLGGRNAQDTTMWYPEAGVHLDLYNHLLSTPNGAFYTDNISSAFVVYQVLAKTTPIEKRQYILYTFDITPSDSTVNAIKGKASQLAAASTNTDEFLENANTAGVQLMQGNSLTSMMASVGQIPNCREVVYWAFKKETQLNDVSDVFSLNGQYYVVATLTKIISQGIPNFEQVKDQIEIEVKRVKKLDAVETKLKEDVTSGVSLADMATKYSSSVRDSVLLTFDGQIYMNGGVENSAIGKIFAQAEQKVPQVISGTNNIYIIVPGMLTPANKENINLPMSKSFLQTTTMGQNGDDAKLNALRKTAEIWDNRARFYQN